MARVSWDSEGILYVNFLTEQGTISAVYYSELLEDQVKPAFQLNDKVF
jgi:hypothetical protein